MNLTRLQTFVEVVRRGTFAGAADALSFTPSAVSSGPATDHQETEMWQGFTIALREGIEAFLIVALTLS